MSRRTEMILLLSILLFTTIMVFLPLFYHLPYKTVTSFDYWGHAIRMRQLDAEGFINFEVDWTNIYRLEGESHYYPPGFSILLYSLKGVGNLDYYAPSLISLLFWPFFCLLLYLIPRKLLGSGAVGLMSAFMGACFISGSNMLGPAFPVASTLAVLMLLLAFLVLLSISNHAIKVLVSALFFGIIFVTHRASIGALILMLPFIAILPLLFTKNRKHFLQNFHYPLLISLFAGLVISVVFWINLPIEDIMTLGGVIPTRIDEMLGFELTKSGFLTVVFGATAFVILLYNLPFLGGRFPRVFEPVVKRKISTLKFLIAVSILPGVLFILVLWIIMSNNLSFPSSPGGFVSLWGSISSLAHQDQSARLFKQILYVWHWNLLPLLLIFPSAYLYLRSNRRNLLLSVSLGAIFTLGMVFVVQDVFFDIKVQRMYFYLSPFVIFLSAWGGYAFLSDKRFNKKLKKFIVFTLAASVAIAAYSSLHVIMPMPPSKIDGITWINEMVSSNDPIASTGFLTQEARGLGQMKFVVMYGLFTIKNNDQLMDYLAQQDARYIFIPPEMYHLNKRVTDIERVYLIYSNEDSNIYLIGR